MDYRLAIFDFDGTLADTLPWMTAAFNDLADEYGFRRVRPEEHERFRALHGRDLLAALELPLWKLPRVMTGMRRKMAQHQGSFSLFPGVPALLQTLHKRGIHVGIVSSNSLANVQRVLGPENSRLVQSFGCGVSLFGKAIRLRQVVRRSGVPAAQAICIGDEIRDAEAAREARIAFGAVTWGHHSAEILRGQKPAAMFSRVEDIVATFGGSEAADRSSHAN